MTARLLQPNMGHLVNVGTLDRLLPVMPYLAVMLSLLVTLVLFLALKSDSQKFRAKVRENALRERQRVDQLAEDLQTLAARPHAAAHSEPVYIPVSAPSGYQLTGFNIDRRVQALRLLRRGKDTAHIAAALGVARQEIELLIRVQQLVAQAKRPVAKASVEEAPDRSSLQPDERLAESRVSIEQVEEAPTDFISPELALSPDRPAKSESPASSGTIRRRKVAALA